MNDIDRAIAYAATYLRMSHSTAELLPGRVLADLWDQREREHVQADATQEEAQPISTGEITLSLVPTPGERVPLHTIGRSLVALAELLDALTREHGLTATWMLSGIGLDDDGSVRIKASASSDNDGREMTEDQEDQDGTHDPDPTS